ncbi:MAG: hypothetical protein NWQ17_09480 [Polaribacter sp.]|nr:hypothetical protein [Polaribacter sp.]
MNSLNLREIKAEEVSNLVWIINSRTDFWDKNTKYLAKEELKRRKISIFEQNKLLKEFSDWDIETEKEWEQVYSAPDIYNLQSVEKTEFSINEKIQIVVTIPFIIKYGGIGPSLFSLYRDKKMKMFWEKLILLALGIILWIGVLNYSFDLAEKKRMEEIEKIDISDWEKEHGYDK